MDVYLQIVVSILVGTLVLELSIKQDRSLLNVSKWFIGSILVALPTITVFYFINMFTEVV